jgi:hypothetical protein
MTSKDIVNKILFNDNRIFDLNVMLNSNRLIDKEYVNLIYRKFELKKENNILYKKLEENRLRIEKLKELNNIS